MTSQLLSYLDMACRMQLSYQSLAGMILVGRMEQFCGIRVITPFEPVDICRLDVFRVVIEVCRQLKRRKLQS